jgi:carboxyl-terminal processing protease
LAAAAWTVPPLLRAPSAAEPKIEKKLDPRAEAKMRIRRAEATARVKRIILDTYVEKVDEEKLFYGALRGMVRELDPHSQFLTPEEYADLNASTTGEFGGLGIEVTVRNGWITVVTPLIGTPAFKAGILPGDRIVKIDGEATDRLSLEEAVHKMRGKPGTRIVLGIARKGQSKLLDVTIVRRIIKVDSVRIPHLVDEKNKIGYVSLTTFQADTADELTGAVKGLERQGMRALIIDLRANGGGRMDAAVKVANLFIADGVIVSTKGRPGARRDNVVYRARRMGTRPDYPLAVLVNQSSASASEIVAGALRDHRRAVLVGEKTFGKASVQTLQRVKIGDRIAGLKLTTAHYYTPAGHLIHKKGIEPDVKVPMELAVLAEVLKKQHEEWIKLNAPKEKEGAGAKPEPGKAEKPPQPEAEAPGKDEDGAGPAKKLPAGEKDAKKAEPERKVVDVQLRAAVQALRAILIDRGRGKAVKKASPEGGRKSARAG